MVSGSLIAPYVCICVTLMSALQESAMIRWWLMWYWFRRQRKVLLFPVMLMQFKHCYHSGRQYFLLFASWSGQISPFINTNSHDCLTQSNTCVITFRFLYSWLTDSLFASYRQIHYGKYMFIQTCHNTWERRLMKTFIGSLPVVNFIGF